MQPLSLARIPLLGGLAEHELQQLSTLVRRRRYGRNEVIFRRGDPGTNLCIIESERVELSLTSEPAGWRTRSWSCRPRRPSCTRIAP